jgi:hypothetical protein
MSTLQDYAAEYRHLLAIVSREAGLADPVTIDLDEFHEPLLRASRKGKILPIEGVLVRDWDPDNRSLQPGIQLGMRLYEIQGIRYVIVRFGYENQRNGWGLNFAAVERKNYQRLYKLALYHRRHSEPPTRAPVLPAGQRELLLQNTIGYLESKNLEKIKAYGGRAKRGLLLTGPPGNGKTMACRWIWEECRQRGWEWRLVTPDSYRSARSSGNIEQLFTVERCGIIFFDDMDLAIRDREKGYETEDQSVFLSAMDGITSNEGVVFIFTTNCSLDLIDRAFKRPGRLDVVMHFNPPDKLLRGELMERWHADIRSGINLELAIAGTEGYTFAELEELRNLLVMRFMDAGEWNWDWALQQFDVNRHDLVSRPRRQVGFALGNGAGKNGSEEIPS